MQQKRQQQGKEKSQQSQNQLKKKKAVGEKSSTPGNASNNILRVIPKDKPEQVTAASSPENLKQQPVVTSSTPDNFDETQSEVPTHLEVPSRWNGAPDSPTQPPRDLSRGLTKQDFVQRTEIRLWRKSSLPDFSQGLVQVELARRWRISSLTIGQNRSRPDFLTWSQQRDPEGIAWEYRPAGQINIPQFLPLMSEEKS